MKSIQARIILTITTVSVVLLAVTGLLLYRSIHSNLVRQFDGSLEAQASAISSFVNFKPDGSLDFDYNESLMPEYRRSPHAQYFVIRFADGRVFKQSSSLQNASLPNLADATIAQDVKLPTGRIGRALSLNFVPQFDPDETEKDQKPSRVKASGMSIVVARDRAMLDSSLNHVLSRMISGMALLAATTVCSVVVIVRHALRPLRAVAERTEQIDATTLHLRLPTSSLPAELTPICSCLNELLERIDQAFARERRFTSDVAHELRTPIAELRSIAEVALKYPDDPAFAKDALLDARAIARQMQALVNTLLTLVRSEHMPQVALEPVPLAAAVAAALRSVDLSGQENHVVVDVPQDALVMAEPTLLCSILRNLISNATEYSEGGAPVRCVAANHDGQWVLSIENQTNRLTPDDLPYIFEPFWRKDCARTDTVHAGLGLSLVTTYCRIMDVKIETELRGPSTFAVQLAFVKLRATPGDGPPGEPGATEPGSSLDHVPSIGSIRWVDA